MDAWLFLAGAPRSLLGDTNMQFASEIKRLFQGCHCNLE